MITTPALLFAEPDFTALDVLHQYIGFVGSFLIVGAATFYFLLMRPALGTNAAAMTAAARLGCIGALLRLLAMVMSINSVMAEKHLSLGAALTGRPSMIVSELLTVAAVLAFGLAAIATRESPAAWMVAAIATLVVMLGAGVITALGSTMESSARGPAVALMVNRFSTIALWSAGLLVLTGVITAYRHLGEVSALWTSVYGKTLIGKLCLVAVVFTLGAYNYRRLAPALGTEESGRRLARSATLEIAIAAIVLIVTAVLVNLLAPAEHM